MVKVAHHPIYCHPLPEGHRFPMIKYELIPQQLLYEGSYEQENFFEPQALSYEMALRVHSKAYLEQLLQLTLPAKAQRKIGFPLTERLVEREFIIT